MQVYGQFALLSIVNLFSNEKLETSNAILSLAKSFSSSNYK